MFCVMMVPAVVCGAAAALFVILVTTSMFAAVPMFGATRMHSLIDGLVFDQVPVIVLGHLFGGLVIAAIVIVAAFAGLFSRYHRLPFSDQ